MQLVESLARVPSRRFCLGEGYQVLFGQEQWLEAMVESQMVKGERKGERYGVDAFVSFRLAEEWSQIRCLLAPFGYCP